MSSNNINTNRNDSRLTSESMMNVFDESLDTTRSNRNMSMTIHENDENEDDLMSKMSVNDYMRSVFGADADETNQNENLTLVEKIRKFLKSNYVHVAIIILVLVDSLCVTIELITDLEATKESEKFKIVENVFKYMGFSILCLFMIEITLKIVFLFKEFIRSKLEVFDAVIVLVSFIIEIVFMNSDGPLAAIAGIIALFRFWRIIRIVNGIILAVEKRANVKIEKLKNGLNALIKENENLKLELNKKQELIDQLKSKQ